jgi:hypothetical protein
MAPALRASLASLILVILTFNVSSAQCVNPIAPNCDFYNKCLEKYCPCGWSESGYALSYGLRYCKRFSETNFSAPARKWRDSTLVCLQERLVPHVPRLEASECNCQAMKVRALASHVDCYTELPSSICLLPLADVAAIVAVVEQSDLSDQEGVRAFLRIALICLKQRPTELWRRLRDAVQAAVKP